MIEQFDQPESKSVGLLEKPVLPRLWFQREDDTRLVQVQRDRFLFNWKKSSLAAQYPNYTFVINQFKDSLSTFESFVTEGNFGVIEPIQYEMTYVNHINFDSFTEIAGIFPDFNWRRASTRFLPDAESFNWQLRFVLPNQAGRLHVTIRNGIRVLDGLKIVLLELTVRGMPKHDSREEMWAWFDLAHEWIVRGFADLTGEEVQQNMWERKQ